MLLTQEQHFVLVYHSTATVYQIGSGNSVRDSTGLLPA